MAWLEEESRMPGSPAWGQLGGCHHVSTASPSPLAPQGSPATSRRVGDRGDSVATAMPEALGISGKGLAPCPTAETLSEKMSFWGNKPQPLSLAGTGGVTSVTSWLFFALGAWRGTCNREWRQRLYRRDAPRPSGYSRPWEGE